MAQRKLEISLKAKLIKVVAAERRGALQRGDIIRVAAVSSGAASTVHALESFVPSSGAHPVNAFQLCDYIYTLAHINTQTHYLEMCYARDSKVAGRAAVECRVRAHI